MAATPSVLDPANIAAAKTAAQHEAIAKAYEAEAATFEKRAASHASLAKTYSVPGTKPVNTEMAKHCSKLSEELQAAAADSRALAAEHRRLAVEAGK